MCKAKIYLEQNKLSEAVRSFKEALKINNDSGAASSKPRALRGLAMTYLAMGNRQEALTSLQEALQIYKKAGIDSPDSQDLQALIEHIDDQKFIREHR